MTKIINLDQLETKQDRGVKLGGEVHYMKTLTVKEYIAQLKNQKELEKLANDGAETPEAADRIMELTVDALSELFPTIKREQLEGLNLDQLNAMRGLADAYAAEDAPEAEQTGE